MAIKTFVQGSEDRELFGIVGGLLTSKDVQVAIGAPIVSGDGSVWCVYADGSGFALADPATERAHIKAVYAETEADRKELLRAMQDVLKQYELSGLYTFAPETDRLWANSGYTMKRHARGSFHTWEK